MLSGFSEAEVLKRAKKSGKCVASATSGRKSKERSRIGVPNICFWTPIFSLLTLKANLLPFLLCSRTKHSASHCLFPSYPLRRCFLYVSSQKVKRNASRSFLKILSLFLLTALWRKKRENCVACTNFLYQTPS